jgi:activator of HSP90 ATPase
MAKTIVQKVVFKNTTPQKLYELYMDAKLHSSIAGSPAKITKKEGSPFSAHGNYITGKNLHLVPGKLIVQTWRTAEWDKSVLDSVFSMSFEQKGKDTVLHAVHSNIPDKSVKSIDKGWHDHYWKPWKQHLAGKVITRPKM